MSLILDALNRSQRDLDNLDAVPSLETIHPVETMSRRNTKGLVIAAVLSCLLVGFVIWWLISLGNTNTVQIDDPASPATAAVSEPPVTDRPTSSPPPVLTSSVVAATSPIQSKPVAALGVPVTESLQNSAVAALYDKSSKPKPVTANRLAMTTSKPQLAGDTAIEAVAQVETIDIDEVLSQAQAGLETAQLQEHSAPFIAELSQQMKDSIPTIYYSVHDYSSAKASSYAVLNGQRVAAGDSVAGKFRVEEILPDSIVLNVRGTQFRLKALNSWVNL